jgi:hypothetical protein
MRRRLAPLVLLVLPTAACLEPPVSESLDVQMLDAGASRVSLTVSLRDPADYVQMPMVRQRLEEEARSYDAGTDAWSDRLRAASPSRERVSVDREKRTLRRVERQADLDTPEDLAALLRDTGVDVAYAHGDGWAELALVPGSSRRATSAQRRLVRAELDRFSEAVAAHIQATDELYAYLERNPGRARACLGAIVSDAPEDEPLSEEEKALIGAVDERIGDLGDVLQIAPDEALTLDELSGLVHDPFPAEVHVGVPGKIVEREGFPGDDDLTIPRLTVWSAYTRLSARWMAPDLALELWRHDREKGGRPIDVGALASLRRRVGVKPSAPEVRRAIERELTPASVYRVRWSTG